MKKTTSEDIVMTGQYTHIFGYVVVDPKRKIIANTFSGNRKAAWRSFSYAGNEDAKQRLRLKKQGYLVEKAVIVIDRILE